MAVLVAVLGRLPPIAAQDPPSTAPVFPVDLDVVNVTVTVRDPAGNLVSNLKRDDFVVLEDGRPQTLQVFARARGGELVGDDEKDKALTIDLGLMLDTSESMLSELKLSQEAATRFLENIPRARDLLTIFFDHDIRISRYDSENQQGLIERLQTAKGGGNTALYDAITVYLSRAQGATGRKVLVMFTDGEDSVSTTTLTDVLQLVRGTEVTIFPIAFRGGIPAGSQRALKPMAFMRELAAMTGGEVFQPSASRDLATVYQKILDQLSAQYVLGFVSDSPRHDAKFRRLKVELGHPGLKARHRTGYYPAPVAAASGRPGTKPES